jgi:hypothetical protein
MDKASIDENSQADSDADFDDAPTEPHDGAMARLAAFQQGELDAQLGYPSEAHMVVEEYRSAYTAGYNLGKV